MKSWEYYVSNPHPYVYYKDIYNAMKQVIDATPMTKDQREAAYKQAKTNAINERTERNLPFMNHQNAMMNEFWLDCRKEFSYSELLDEEGCRVIENHAWEEGHSNGFSEVYNKLKDLDDLVCQIIQHAKPKKD